MTSMLSEKVKTGQPRERYSDTRVRAFELLSQGRSYGAVAAELGITRSAAAGYAHRMRASRKSSKPVVIVEEIEPTTRDDTLRPVSVSDGILRGKPIARRLLDILKAAEGRPVPLVQITEHVYSDRLDGGPLRAADVVRASVRNLRRLGMNVEFVQAYRVVISRMARHLSPQEQEVFDLMQETRGLGGRRVVAARLGIRPNQVSVVMSHMRTKGVVIVPCHGYRLSAAQQRHITDRVELSLAEPVLRPSTPRRKASQRTSSHTPPSRPAQNALAMKAFGILHRAGDRLVTWAELHDALYGHRRDGGPEEGVAKAIRWLGSVGVDVRREHRYFLPKSPRRSHVTRPSCLAVLDAIGKCHDDLDAIVAATGLSRNAVLTAISRCTDFGLEIESVQGYRLHWHSVDRIHQPDRKAA